MTLLAIDPGRSYKGEKTIGVCLFSTTGKEIWRGSLSWEELFGGMFSGLDVNIGHDEISMWFNGPRGSMVFERITEVVCEDFVNDPKSARGGQRNGTSETIGGIETLCRYLDIPFWRQPSRILGPAKLLAGYEDTHKHLPHQDSAYLHGYYYLVGKGILQSADLADTL